MSLPRWIQHDRIADHGVAGKVARGVAVQFMLLPLALSPIPAQAQSNPETTTRSTEFEYHEVHGQVTLERIDPGLNTCVEKAYAYDTRGNKIRVTVRPCANVTAAQPTWFAPRITVNEFSARTTEEPGIPAAASTLHGADAYLTRTRSGAPNTAGTDIDTNQPRTEDEAVYDIRFGAAVRQTSVALADATKNLHARTEYDGFGRVFKQTSALGTFVQTAYKICPQTGPADPVCITFDKKVDVKSPSKRMVDAQGNITDEAIARAISAYYIESTPRAADGAVMGATSRVHYDALHREIAKETQTYDGRWSRTLTAYDQLGMAVASWGPHFADNGSTPPPEEMRQWTAKRDLLHRPEEQRQYVRTGLDPSADVKAIKEVRTTLSYNGLESSATGPAADGSQRTTKSIKNGAGQTAQTIDAYGATLNMAYDAQGQLRKTVDALGNITTIEYTPTTARFKTAMTDPDLGRWSYTYDALGQLKSQTDAKQQATGLSYDVLGRLVAKTNPTLNANWYHDRDANGAWCASGLSRLCEATAGNTVLRSQRHVYDVKGRPVSTDTTLDRTYTSSVSYDDNTGALASMTYPSNFKLRYSYSTAAGGKTPGVLETVADAAPGGRTFWSIASQDKSAVFDARGNLLQSNLGNGVVTQNSFDPISGKALALRARSNAGIGVDQSDVLNQTIEYDQVNNIVTRNTAAVGIGLTETFRYDLLDRLTTYGVGAAGDASAMRTVTMTYNAIGSILSKSDVGGLRVQRQWRQSTPRGAQRGRRQLPVRRQRQPDRHHRRADSREQVDPRSTSRSR